MTIDGKQTELHLVEQIRKKHWKEVRHFVGSLPAVDSIGPLHAAISKGAPEDFTLSLISKCEDTVLTDSSKLWMLLYRALVCGAPYKVIRRLVHQFPPVLDERHCGRTLRDCSLPGLDERVKDLLATSTTVLMEEQAGENKPGRAAAPTSSRRSHRDGLYGF